MRFTPEVLHFIHGYHEPCGALLRIHVSYEASHDDASAKQKTQEAIDAFVTKHGCATCRLKAEVEDVKAVVAALRAEVFILRRKGKAL